MTELPDHFGEISEQDSRILQPEIDSSLIIIGLGIDIVANERVARMLDRFGDRFTGKYFTPAEADFCLSRPEPVPDFAARLAAKESSFKGIGARRGMGIGWTDFEVVMGEKVIPRLELRGRAKDRGIEIGITKIWLSLTHEDLWSAAVVIVCGDSQVG